MNSLPGVGQEMPPPVTKPAVRGEKNNHNTGGIMKAISPKINDSSAEFYPSVFSNLHSGAAYVLDSFPRLYQRTLHEMRGKFMKGELSLMIDVMNATMLTPQSAGYHLAANVADGIALDGLDAKWEIDGEALNKKLAELSVFDLACLEIWANGFWYRANRPNDDFEAWVAQLKGDPITVKDPLSPSGRCSPGNRRMI